MTFTDWVHESKGRYRDKPVGQATVESGMAFLRGGIRRIDQQFGTTVWERGDWDVLIILDACRADLWADVAHEYDLPEGDVIRSNAACSIDWINYNFNNYSGLIENAGYVTANPFSDHDAEHARSADLRDSDLGHFRPLYETEWEQIDTEPPIETVPPERVTDHAIEAWRNRDVYGIDQLVVHYMQPHEPFIARPEWSYETPQDNAVLKNLVTEDYQAGTSPWRRMIDCGEVSPEEFWPIYQDNLRWALDDVAERLLPNLDGQAVISADHGNGLGEWGEWHHPPGAIGPAVRNVPWVPLYCHDEETVIPDIDDQEGTDDETNKQLAALGYI